MQVDLVPMKETIQAGRWGDQHSAHVRAASLSQVERCREMKMLLFLTEVVTSEEERFFFFFEGKENVFGILCFGTLLI